MTNKEVEVNIDKYEDKSTKEVEARIETLTIRMNRLAKDGNYADADRDNIEILKLQELLVKRGQHEAGLKQEAELNELRKAFSVLKEQFNTLWDEEMNNFDKDSAKQVVAMKYRQENEMKDLHGRLERERENYPKFSAEVVALRKNEKLLVVEKKFKEALKVKEKADMLQVQEVQKFEKAEDSRIKSILSQLQTKHEDERNGLGRRLDRERRELQLQKENDFKKIEQRYINIQKERDTKIKIDTNKERRAQGFAHHGASSKIQVSFQNHEAVKFPQALAPLLAKNLGPGATTKSTTKKFGAGSMSKTSRSTTAGAGATAGAGSDTEPTTTTPAASAGDAAPAGGKAESGGDAGSGETDTSGEGGAGKA